MSSGKRLERMQYQHFPCTYRKGCVNTEYWFVVTTFFNRYGNQKERWRSCCESCAVHIQQKWPDVAVEQE